jgi:hypothetical protein
VRFIGQWTNQFGQAVTMPRTRPGSPQCGMRGTHRPNREGCNE